MTDGYFDADGNPFVFEGGVDLDEPEAAPRFDPRGPLPGWYAAPDEAIDYPWYWDGLAWIDPAGRLSEMLCQLTADRIYGIAERAHQRYEPKIQRKYYWHLFKNIFWKA